MGWSHLVGKLRRPMTVTASIAVVAATFAPIDVQPSERPTLRRVIATPVPVPVFTPQEMAIPKLDVEGPVVPVGTEPDGTMGSPVGAVDVGWWFGRKPGEGNALFAAHVDWGGSPGPFARLGDLDPGDEVIVRGRNRTLTYRITWLRTFDRNIDATDVLGNESGQQVATLITCFGPFDRSIGTRRERLVARAELVSA